MESSGTTKHTADQSSYIIRVKRATDPSIIRVVEMKSSSSFSEPKEVKVTVKSVITVVQDDLSISGLTCKELRFYDKINQGYRKLDELDTLGSNFISDGKIEIYIEDSQTISSPNSPNKDYLTLKLRVEQLEKEMLFIKNILSCQLGPDSDLDSTPSHFEYKDHTASHENIPLKKIFSVIDPKLESAFPTPYLGQPSKSVMGSPQQKMERTFSEKPRLDFAILYSNPLVDTNQVNSSKTNSIYIIDEPVNFVEECKTILNSLKHLDRKLTVDVECATQEMFLNILKKKPLPTVCHIMCHGSLDTTTGSYFLEFEDKDGELLKLNPVWLERNLNGVDLSDIKVLFLNACHSEVNFGK